MQKPHIRRHSKTNRNYNRDQLLVYKKKEKQYYYHKKNWPKKIVYNVTYCNLQLLKYEVDINEKQILDLLDKVVNVKNLNLIIKDYLFEVIQFNVSTGLRERVDDFGDSQFHMIYINHNTKLYTFKYYYDINVVVLSFDNIEILLISDGVHFYSKLFADITNNNELVHDIINIYNFLFYDSI